jgi:hypothetical protein
MTINYDRYREIESMVGDVVNSLSRCKHRIPDDTLYNFLKDFVQDHFALQSWEEEVVSEWLWDVVTQRGVLRNSLVVGMMSI